MVKTEGYYRVQVFKKSRDVYRLICGSRRAVFGGADDDSVKFKDSALLLVLNGSSNRPQTKVPF